MEKFPVHKINRFNQLDKQTKEFIIKETEREFGWVPVVKKYTWSKPDHTVMLINSENKILAFYNIVERECRFDGSVVRVSGINNLITPVKHRGLGYGSELMSKSANLFFNDLGAEFGLLLCADNLIPFYERFGWFKTRSRVIFDQPGKRKGLWQANIMLLSGEDMSVHPDEIDLCGLPW
jgi:predicted acetyltransferase